MSAIPKSSNKAIHDALRVLAREIQSGDCAANVAIAEGADRISELGNEVERLERENAALREDRDRLDDVLASFYPAVAPLVEHYPVTPWEHMKDGRCRGSWAEDGSPYYFTVPHQLVPAFFALQRFAKLCRDKDAARKEAKP